MNKTISINIGGMFFQIDEEAYKILESYLESLKKHFANTEGSEEIIQDIEARIGEIFQTKIEAGQLLILKENVEEAIKILGKPGDIGSNDSEKETKKEPNWYSKKRLFRDEENRVIAGVCSGLGHYLEIDPVWFRLAFLLSILFAGTGVLIYIILWIIIPYPKTTEDRMNMRGTPLTISEIEQNIKNEFNDLKARFHEMKDQTKRRTRREVHEMKRKMRQAKQEAKYSYSQRYMASAIASPQTDMGHHYGFGSVFGEILYYFIRALLIFVGIILLIIGIVLIGSLILSLTASDSFLFFTKWGISSISLPAFSNLFFENSWQEQLVVISLILLIIVPLVMLVFNSIRLIAGFRTKIKIVSITASLLWLTGLVLAIILTINIIGNFSEKSFVKQEITLPQPKEYLTIDVTDNLPGIKAIHYFDEDDYIGEDMEHQRFIFNNCYFSNDVETLQAYGFPKLKIVPAKTNEYKLTVVKFSRGTTVMAAHKRAEAIKAGIITQDSTVIINNYFQLPANEKWRNQSVKLILEVPEGKCIFMTKKVDNLIYDSDNIDESWDFDMTGKKMMMHDGQLIESSEVMIPDTIQKKGTAVKAGKPVVYNKELPHVMGMAVFV